MSLMPLTGGPVVRRVRASVAQELRWRGSAFDAVNRVYRLRGPVSVPALQAAFTTVVRRHESLRCAFHDDGVLTMCVHADPPSPLHHIDVPGADPAERESWLAAWLDAEVRTVLDRGAPLRLRATLARLGPQEHVLVLVVDHIVADGWSIDLLARELGLAYRAALGEAVTLPAEVTQYPEWVARERERLTDEEWTARTAFWRERFPGGPGDVAVPLSGYRAGATAGLSAATIEASLDREVAEALRRAARRLGVTLYGLTATVLVRLLQEDSGQRRITLSTSSAARFSPETADMIGYLATTVWIPTTLEDADDLPSAARAFQRDLFDVLARSDVPARAVFTRLWGPRARTMMDAVPQVGFLCTPFWGESLALPDVAVEGVEVDDGGADTTFAVYLVDRKDRIDVQARFVPGALDDGYAARMLDRYLHDLSAAANAADRQSDQREA